MNYKDTKLDEILKSNLEKLNYESLTKIQELALPLALEDHNIIGLAQTGTGKTAAFLLPILQNIITDRKNDTTRSKNPVAIILAPTRDLIDQIYDNFLKYSRGTQINGVLVYGGMPYQKQIRAIEAGVDIVFANTGRLMDLAFKKRILDVSDVKYFVLDEADLMLDMGFSKDIITITNQLKSRKQTFLFSATMPKQIKDLISKIFNNDKYETVSAIEKNSIHNIIKQEVYLVDHSKRTSVLIDLLKKIEAKQAIVFCRTKHETRNMHTILKDSGFKVDSLHSERSQTARAKALKMFKSFDTQILVATNVAARGIDVSGLEYVFNYNLPDDNETFVHRIGRTGRSGKEGTAITLISPNELHRLKDIERLINIKIEVIKNDAYLNKEYDENLDNFPGYNTIKSRDTRSSRGGSSGSKSYSGFNSRSSSPRSFSGERKSYGDRSNSGGSSYGGERRTYGDRSSSGGERRTYGDRSSSGGERRTYGDRSNSGGSGFSGERRTYGDRSNSGGSSFGGERKSYGDRSSSGGRSFGGERKSYGDRSNSSSPYGERRSSSSFSGERKSYGDRSSSSYGDKRSSGDRSSSSYGDKRSSGGDRRNSSRKPDGYKADFKPRTSPRE